MDYSWFVLIAIDAWLLFNIFRALMKGYIHTARRWLGPRIIYKKADLNTFKGTLIFYIIFLVLLNLVTIVLKLFA